MLNKNFLKVTPNIDQNGIMKRQAPQDLPLKTHSNFMSQNSNLQVGDTCNTFSMNYSQWLYFPRHP